MTELYKLWYTLQCRPITIQSKYKLKYWFYAEKARHLMQFLGWLLFRLISLGIDEMLDPVELLVFLGVWISSRLLLRWWNCTDKETRRYPPSLPSLPLVGSLPFLRGFKNLADFFLKKVDELGPIFTFRAGSKYVKTLFAFAIY